MVRTGKSLWRRHPAADNSLAPGEKAADWLKHWFGTWVALSLVAAVIVFWVGAQQTAIAWDAYPFILLNLCLSCLAAVQGIILQISANRGDRISARVALHTEANTGDIKTASAALMSLQEEQMAILRGLDHVSEELSIVRAAVAPDGRGLGG